MSAKKNEKPNIGFEEAMSKLQNIVESLEAGEASLEVALDQFEEGMKLARFCDDELNAASVRVEKIVRDHAGQEKRTAVDDSQWDGESHDL